MQVLKTDKEINLNDIYMRWLRSSHPIPLAIVTRFKKDVEIIRAENKIYQ